MTNTSQPRTFSSIFTLMFSLENRVTLRRPRVTPASAAIDLASAGWLLPAKIFRAGERLTAGLFNTTAALTPTDHQGFGGESAPRNRRTPVECRTPELVSFRGSG